MMSENYSTASLVVALASLIISILVWVKIGWVIGLLVLVFAVAISVLLFVSTAMLTNLEDCRHLLAKFVKISKTQ